MDIQIVYNTFINRKREDWLSVIGLQMEGLIANGLASRASQIYICISSESTDETNAEVGKLLKAAVNFIKTIIPKARIIATMMNRYEYPGIRKVWEIGQSLDEAALNKTLILYFHSKGMFNTKDQSTSRDPIERRLFTTVIDRWEYIEAKFNELPFLNKAGYGASPEGFIWLNFWFARASYIRTLVCPIISRNRYYYEDWLARIDRKHLWPRVMSMDFPESNKENASTAILEQNTGLEEGALTGTSADCMSMCKFSVPLGHNFTKHSVWKCRPMWLDRYLEYTDKLYRLGEWG